MSPSAAERCGLQPLVDESFGGTAGGIGTTTRQGRVHYAKLTLKHVAAAEEDAEGDEGLSVTQLKSLLKSRGVHEAKINECTERRDLLALLSLSGPAVPQAAPQLEVAFDVMTWPPHVDFEAIIGIDFLARNKGLIDVCRNTLQLTTLTGERLRAPLRTEQ